MLATKSVLRHLEVIEGKLCEDNWVQNRLHLNNRFCLLGHLSMNVDWSVYCRAHHWVNRTINKNSFAYRDPSDAIARFNDGVKNVEEVKQILRKSADYMRKSHSNTAARKYIEIAIERIKKGWKRSTSLQVYLSGDQETMELVEEVIHRKYGRRMDLSSFSRFVEDENAVISLLNDAKDELV